MRYFLNLSIKWKLVLGFGIGLLSLLLVASAAIHAMTALRDTQTEIQEVQLNNVIDYLALDANLSRNRVLLHRLLRSNDPVARAATQREIAVTNEENDSVMLRLAQRVVRDPLPQEKFAALKLARDEFIRVRDSLIIPAIMAGRLTEAESAFDIGTERYHVVSARVTELAELAKDNVRATVEQSIALVHRAVLAVYAIALAAALFSGLAILQLHRAIALPVTRVAEAATRIAAGELDVSMPLEQRQDEIGTLERAFNRMTTSLLELALVADHIADGDLGDLVKPRSKGDRLTISFDIMSQNLQGLASEMKSGAAEANAVTLALLELTREFVADMAAPRDVQRFQETLLRLEELSKRLNTVADQLKLPTGR